MGKSSVLLFVVTDVEVIKEKSSHISYNKPVLVVAFEGWNDAGDAASGAARWLADRHEAELVATLDAEEYFDFTATRPLIELDETGVRRLTWPDAEIWAATTDGPRDLVVLLGNEPHLRWRTFCREVLDLADALGCSLIVTLGALLSELPHTRPTVVSGTTEDPTLLDRLELTRSSYEGPTGILGVLHAQARADDRPSVSLWASVPTYVSTAPMTTLCPPRPPRPRPTRPTGTAATTPA